MSNDLVNLTLPMTQQGLNVVLTTVGVAVLCGAVYLMLASMDQKGRARGQRWLEVLGWVFAPVWLLLFVGTMWQVWLILNLRDSALGQSGLGAGALIAALLGAPFVIWGTWLRHKTQRIEQEGHMTDRINKAVEQLGVEKTVKKHLENTKGKQVYEKGPDGKPDFARPVIVEETVPNLEVRIGAILSLERIAQDSTIFDKGRDHVRVMEILCVYIRENSNARKPVDFPLPDWEPLKDDPSDEERAEHLAWRKGRFKGNGGSLTRQWARKLPKPRVDVQQALHVIGRRNADQRKVEAAWPNPPTTNTLWPFDRACPSLSDKPGERALSQLELLNFRQKLAAWKAMINANLGYRLDLRGTNLQGADMAAKRPDGSDAIFSGALLNNARMEGAALRDARMEGAALREVRMEGADLGEARMEGADLGEARMEGAFLALARMEGAKLSSARTEGAILWCARIEGANLEDARMEGAVLGSARMEGANLRRGRMEGAEIDGSLMDGADLTHARMEGADLWGARMEGANLWGTMMDSSTVLSYASLQGAALKAANFVSVALSSEQVKSAYGDASVKLPAGIARPGHWPDWNLPMFDEKGFPSEWRKWQANPDTYTPPQNPNP